MNNMGAAQKISTELLTTSLMEIINILGYRLPQEDLTTDYAKAVVWAVILGLSILAWPVSVENRRNLLWAWAAKSFVTLGFMLFHEWHYPLDAGGYFDESRRKDFEWHVSQPGVEKIGTANMTNLCWLLQHFVPNSYHGLKISFAMLGLIAIYLFYRAAVMFLGREDRRVFFLLAYWPTVLFWSSILSKDPIVLLGIALYVYGVLGFVHMKKARFLPVLALGIMVAMAMRPWLGVIMFVPFVFLVLRRSRSLGTKVIAWLLAGSGLWYASNRFADYFLLASFEDLMEVTDSITSGFADPGKGAGSSQVYTGYGGIGGVVVFLPLGIFTTLFRPLPGEVLNVFGFLASLENVVTLSLVWLAVRRTRWEELKEPMVMWALMFVAMWSVVYAVVSGYNLGTASRYRLQILPILIYLLVYLARRRSVLASLAGSQCRQGVGHNTNA